MTNEQLVQKIKNGYSVTDNMQKLYENNLPIIKQVIKPYTAYENMEDLLQEAYFGLWEAVQHYESSENVLFMTYAVYWIRQAVVKYLDKCSSLIRIPSNAKQRIIRYKKTIDKLLQEYGRTPTDEEIIKAMNISISDLDIIKIYAYSIMSLDTPLNDETEDTIGNNIKDDYIFENDVVDKMYNDYAKDELWHIVERYTSDRENHIVCSRFIDKETLQDIADRLGISKNRVRQLEASALSRLRCSKALKELQERFEVVNSSIYKNSARMFREHDFTSTVEHIAITRAELMEAYKRRMEEIERLYNKKKNKYA